MAARRRAGCWAVLLLSACAGPALEVRTDPADAVVFADGRRLRGPVLPFSYYGTLAIDALPPAGPGADPTLMPVRRNVALPEPVTPWIFPLDFAGELLVRAFGGVPDRRIEIAMPASPEPVVEGQPPQEAAQLSERARAARVQR